VNGIWHRVGVYWCVREDPDLRARWDAERPDLKTRVVGALLGLPVLLAAFSVVALVILLIAGGDTDPGNVIWAGTRLFFAVGTSWALVAGVVRWARWFGARST
jgi:hypothetical protein